MSAPHAIRGVPSQPAPSRPPAIVGGTAAARLRGTAVKLAARVPDGEHEVEFEEHEHSHSAHDEAAQDHNIRSAYVHVMADAAVSVLTIIGLVLARTFGWLWRDPLAGFIGALVIANWSYGLMRDTGAILLDINPDRRMEENVRHAIEDRGDKVVDLYGGWVRVT